MLIGLVLARDLAIAVIPNLIETVQPCFFDRAAHERAELSVHRRPDLLVILECETDAVD